MTTSVSHPPDDNDLNGLTHWLEDVCDGRIEAPSQDPSAIGINRLLAYLSSLEGTALHRALERAISRALGRWRRGVHSPLRLHNLLIVASQTTPAEAPDIVRRKLLSGEWDGAEVHGEAIVALAYGIAAEWGIPESAFVRLLNEVQEPRPRVEYVAAALKAFSLIGSHVIDRSLAAVLRLLPREIESGIVGRALEDAADRWGANRVLGALTSSPVEAALRLASPEARSAFLLQLERAVDLLPIEDDLRTVILVKLCKLSNEDMGRTLELQVASQSVAEDARDYLMRALDVNPDTILGHVGGMSVPWLHSRIGAAGVIVVSSTGEPEFINVATIPDGAWVPAATEAVENVMADLVNRRLEHLMGSGKA